MTNTHNQQQKQVQTYTPKKNNVTLKNASLQLSDEFYCAGCKPKQNWMQISIRLYWINSLS